MSSRSRLFPLATSAVVLITGCVAMGGRAARNEPGVVSAPVQPEGDTEPMAKRPAFDADRAFKLLEKQCEFGPRPVGTPAHRKTADFLFEEMKKHADKALSQNFTYRNMPLTNIIGVFNPEASKKVLLCAHWDTRPTADEEVDPAKRKQPILGANDGASGVAILLELARMFREQKPAVGVVIVLFDGEDYGDFSRNEGVFLGSTYFARNVEPYRAEFGILLDMVGDKDLNIHREKNSQYYAPGTNAKVFRIAKERGHGAKIIDNLKYEITDDHIPLNTIARIPTIDLIDFDYAPWHTLDDTPDKCSPHSLYAVGDTLAEVVYREKAQ